MDLRQTPSMNPPVDAPGVRADDDAAGEDDSAAETHEPDESQPLRPRWPWLLFGMAGPWGVALVTARAVITNTNNEDWPAAATLVLAPIAWICVTVFALAVAWFAEREAPTPEEHSSRVDLVGFGVVIPIMIAVAIYYAGDSVEELFDAFGNAL